MKRILSIDGGGIRGILPGQILARLEEIIKEKTGEVDAKIGDYFDLIAGTSTGGILATFLLCPDENGRAKYDAKTAVDVYIKRGGEIFSRSLIHGLKSLGGIAEEQYEKANLEHILKSYLGEELWLKDLVSPCLITAYDIENRKSHFFNQMDTKKASYNFRVWEVARATSAAPTYFEPAKITNEIGEAFTLIDGGVFANNPSLCAYVEARQNFHSSDGDKASAKDLYMVSLGTGSVEKPYMYNKAKSWGVAMWLKPLVDIMMSGSSETVDFQLQNIFASENVSDQYVRIEPPIGSADVQMDNVKPENIQALKVAGMRAADNYQEKLEQVADELIRLS